MVSEAKNKATNQAKPMVETGLNPPATTVNAGLRISALAVGINSLLAIGKVITGVV